LWFRKGKGCFKEKEPSTTAAVQMLKKGIRISGYQENSFQAVKPWRGVLP
jgi:hypothetical protein